MRPLLEFWLSLSRPNRIAVDCLLFWLAAGSVLGLGALGNGAVREFVKPFLVLTVAAGTAGAVVAALESMRLVLAHRRLPQDEFERQQKNRRNLRVAALLAVVNAFPAFVLGLAWIRGMRLFD
jgi:hypothetical protein